MAKQKIEIEAYKDFNSWVLIPTMAIDFNLRYFCVVWMCFNLGFHY